jgi:hemerythrin-like domain-containing protein
MGGHAHAKSPTAILREEHAVIVRVLDGLEGVLARIEAGGDADPTLLEDAVHFIRGFADRCHHEKEEEMLFPALEAAGIPVEGGPVGVMLAEHQEGREYVRGLAEGVADLATSPDRGRRGILDNGWAYIQLLRAHIMKENEILFPLADRAISPDAMHGLTHAFEDAQTRFGEATLAGFLAVADKIEAEGKG